MENSNGKEFHPVPNWLTKEYLEQIFRNYKKSEDLQIINLEFGAATNKGENFASIMTRVTLNFNCSNKSNCSDATYSYIVKSSFEENKFANEVFKEYQTFECEMNMYENVLPKLTGILRRINKDEFIFPEVIFVDREHTAVILEDLSEKKYITVNRIERLTMEQAEYALIKMSKMHAASIVLSNELGNDYLKSFDRGLINRHAHKFSTFYNGMIETCSDVAMNMGGEYKIYSEKLKKLNPYILDKTQLSLDIFDNHLNVLNHGDFWTNNIMYKYNENNEIENIVIIDFQFSKWSSPAWDLYYFFNTSLKEEIRYKRQEELFYIYYENLTATLKKLNFNLKTIPSLHEFCLQMSQKEIIALVITLTSGALLINEQNDDADFDTLINNDEKSKKFKRVIFSNESVLLSVKNMLPVYNRRGLLDV